MKITIKKTIVVLLLSFFNMIGTTGMVFAQPADKFHVYVWDFSVSDDSLNTYGESFRNDFETQLIGLDKYVVLERRRYDRIMAHQDMENEISDIRDLSSKSKDNLKTNRADAVFFGTLNFDDGSGEYELIISFQDLNGNNLKKESIVFKKGIIMDNASRKTIVTNLLEKLYKKEALSAKQQQFEFIDEKLNQYRARADEISKRYGEIIEMLLVQPDPFEYAQELKQKIEAYNQIWNDLNDNKGKYLQDFASHWNKDRLRDFKDIYSKIMNDFHERFIRKLDEVVLEINNYRGDQSSSQKEKETKKNRIVTNTRNMASDTRTELNNTIKPQINRFLDKLRDELISN